MFDHKHTLSQASSDPLPRVITKTCSQAILKWLCVLNKAIVKRTMRGIETYILHQKNDENWKKNYPKTK